MDESRAFNEGADSRIRGEPLTANPYGAGKGSAGWIAGWLSAHRSWGADVKRRSVTPLPAVGKWAQPRP